MKTRILSLSAIAVLVLSFSCGSQKEVVNPKDKAQLDAFVNSRSIHLEARTALPMATRSMNAVANSGLLPPGSNASYVALTGMNSYLRIKNDSVFANLPYYGERQITNGPNSDEGIEFAGLAKNFTITYNEKKQRYDFSFDINGKGGEAFDVSGMLFPNLRTTFNINSNQRFGIGYSGDISALE